MCCLERVWHFRDLHYVRKAKTRIEYTAWQVDLHRMDYVKSHNIPVLVIEQTGKSIRSCGSRTTEFPPVSNSFLFNDIFWTRGLDQWEWHSWRPMLVNCLLSGIQHITLLFCARSFNSPRDCVASWWCWFWGKTLVSMVLRRIFDMYFIEASFFHLYFFHGARCTLF